MKSFAWFLIGIVFGWVVFAAMYPEAGELMLQEDFIPQAIATVKGWFIR